jgi:hypothetical protein
LPRVPFVELLLLHARLFSTRLKEVTSSNPQNLYYKCLDCFRRPEADNAGIPRFIEF